MTLQTVVFANEATFSSLHEKTKSGNEEIVVDIIKDKNHRPEKRVENEKREDDSSIPVRTHRKRINPKTDKYEMAKPKEGEVRVITTYKNRPDDGIGRKLGSNHKAMNVSRSNLDIMLASDDIAMVENDHLVYSTSTDVINGESSMNLSVMIGNYYPSSFDSLAVEEYHEKDILGKDIKIAIFDTGLSTKSTELNIVGGATFVDGSDSFADDSGHGTSMAGIIGAAMDNEGLTGIAPEAELYSVKVLDSNGVGYTSGVIEGIYWAVENDIDIICFGFASDEYSNALADAVTYAKSKGIFMIAPSGNDRENAVKYPAGYNEVISVGSVNDEGTISVFSNIGATVDFFAPGENVDSIVYVNNKPTPFSGTSASAAHAAGFAALLLEENKENAEFDVFEYFLSTAVETELGFVENTVSEASVISVDEMETVTLQRSADEIAVIHDEDSSLMSTRASANTIRVVAVDTIIDSYELSDEYEIDYYSFYAPAVSQSIFFNLKSGNCRIIYEDEYSGVNLEVTDATISLQKGHHNFYICFDEFASFDDTEAYSFKLETIESGVNEKGYYAGHGVDTATGNFNYTFDDLKTIVAGQEFKIQRFYNSRDVEETNASCISSGWMLNYGVKADYYTTLYFRLNEDDIYEEVYEEDENVIVVITPEGEALNFIKRADGVWNPNNSRAEIDTNSDLTNRVIVTMPDQTKYYYYPIKRSSGGLYPDTKSLGCLYKVVDRYGNTTNITVNDGLVEEIIDASGNVYSFTYGTSDNLISISDSNGRTITYTYRNGTLVQSTDAIGITHYYSYSSGYLSEIKNSNNETIVSLTYEMVEDDIRERVKTLTDKYGTTYEYGYDTVNYCTTISEIPEYEEDAYRESSTTYDIEKDLIYLEDALGRQSTIEYYYQQTNGYVGTDADGNPCIIVDDDYHKWKNGEILRKVDYDGLITEYSFDPFGNGLAESKTVTNSSGTILEYEEYEYNLNGDITLLESWISKPDTVSERTRKATRFEYDGTKLIKKAEYLPILVGRATVPALNSANLSKYAVTSYEYDTDNAIKGLVSKVVYPAQYTGATTDKGWVYEYDSKGNQISVINPESTETNEIKDVYEYNDFGLVSKHISGEGVVAEYEYNNNLQETKKTVTTENGTEVTFTAYNNLGLPTQIVSPNEYNAAYEEDDGTYSDETVGVRYTYYDNGTLASETDSEGNSIQYEYDRFGNIQTKTMPNGLMYKYSYNDISNIILEYYRWNNKNYIVYDHYFSYESGNTSHQIGTIDDNNDEIGYHTVVYNHFGKEVEYRDMYENGLERYRRLFYDLQGNLVNEFYIDRDSLKHKETYYTNDSFDASANTTFDEKFASIDVMWGTAASRSFDIPDDTTYKYERTDYDKNGNVVQTLVSTVAEGNIPTLADANVITETSEYYADNLLKCKTDVYGVKTEYEYDKDRNLSKVTVTEPGKDSQIVSYTNSHNGKPETIKTYVDTLSILDDKLLSDSVGKYVLTTNTYDKNGNLKRQVSSSGLVTEYTYNKNNLQISVESIDTLGEDELSVIESCDYDFRGNVTEQTDKNGNVTEFVYNELGYLIYTIHPNGRITLTTRDKYGKLVAEVDAVDYNGAATPENATVDTYETDKENLATMNRTEYTYDQFDRVVKVTRHTYDPETETTTSVDRQTNTYDAYGNLIITVDANGNTIGYEYDAFGNCTKYIEPSKYAPAEDFDEEEGEIRPFTTFYEYDMLGRKIKEGNEYGNYYAYTYDKKGNILSSAIVEDGESQTISTYTYDKTGNLLTQTDGNGNVTEVLYDDSNRPIRHSTRIGGEVNYVADYYAHDGVGNLVIHTDKNDNYKDYVYDAFNRLVEIICEDGTVVTYTYDGNGNILTMTDSTGETEYTYDSMGRILTKTHSVTGTVSYEYDIYTGIPYGYVAEITTEPDEDTVEKWYDSEDKLVKVVDGTDITWYTYYDDGRLKSTTKPDGSVSTNTYDDEGNLLTLVTLDAAEDVLDSFTYVYDDNSIGYKNQISKTEIVAGENKGTTSYEYDIQGRLTKVTNPDESTNEYTYDDAGNRLSKTTTSGETVVVTNYTYDEQNRLTQSVTGNATTYYGYDNNGNQISEWTRIASVSEATDGVNLGLQSDATDDLLTLYAYDAFDRLVKIEQGADVIENAYTADGKKLSRTTNGEVTYYVYDGNVVIEEQDEDNDETSRNVYGRNLITRETSDNKVVYGFNGHGDVVYYTNLDNIVLVVYDYDEFGNVIREENVVNSVSTLLPSIAGSTETATETIWASIESIDNPYRYAGYEYIEEVKLYDLNARYYNPEIARFLSADPYYNLGNRVIGLYEINVPNAWSIIQANALYAYCGNNPIIFFDMLGLDINYIVVIGADRASNNNAFACNVDTFKKEHEDYNIIVIQAWDYQNEDELMGAIISGSSEVGGIDGLRIESHGITSALIVTSSYSLEKNDSWSKIEFKDEATITFTGCNTGGSDGEANENSIAQYVANETGNTVYAYVNNTSQKAYDASGTPTSDWRKATKYYQEPVRKTYNQKVVEDFTEFTPIIKESTINQENTSNNTIEKNWFQKFLDWIRWWD